MSWVYSYCGNFISQGANCFAAIVVAIRHYVFFHSLNGRPVDETVKQEYISAISIALVTVFRAALKVSLATIYAQLLWYV
jgi:hypothetical protein